MSYILDALKKIEHEKNKKRPDGRVSISGDLFQERKQPAARTGIWKFVALIAVASLLTCAGTWFFFQGSGRKSRAIIRRVAPPSPVPANPPVVAAPAIPAPASVPPAPQVTPAAVPPVVPPAAVAPVVKPVIRKAQKAVKVVKGVSAKQDNARSKKTAKVQPASVKQPDQTVPAPADIKLSGIAWQDEHIARRAVINGFLLKEGSVVSGAKITDIQADRVRFSSSSGNFEIRLDGIIPAELKQ